MRFIGWLIALCLMATSSGCAPGIPGTMRSQATYHGTFSELQAAPDEFLGQVVLLGGEIIRTRGSEITVLQLPLDGRGRPKVTDLSRGRYLVVSSQFLDPAIYSEGTFITVLGKVTGKVLRPIGEYDYAYPEVKAMEMTIWPKSDIYGPSFQFGIGFGTWFQ